LRLGPRLVVGRHVDLRRLLQAALELTDALAEGAHHFRQPTRAEDDEDDDEHDHQLAYAQTEHASDDTGGSAGWQAGVAPPKSASYTRRSRCGRFATSTSASCRSSRSRAATWETSVARSARISLVSRSGSPWRSPRSTRSRSRTWGCRSCTTS